jgi:hypothetical protein
VTPITPITSRFGGSRERPAWRVKQPITEVGHKLAARIDRRDAASKNAR